MWFLLIRKYTKLVEVFWGTLGKGGGKETPPLILDFLCKEIFFSMGYFSLESWNHFPKISFKPSLDL